MNGFQTTVRRALRRARRLGSSLGLAAVVLTSLPGAAIPAHAVSPPREAVQAPARADGGAASARIQINLISVTVVNDRDGAFRGAGDFTMSVGFWRCSSLSGPCASDQGLAAHVAEWTQQWSADSGDFKPFERIMPTAADVKESGLASEEAGFALHAGNRYVFQVNMFERDGGGGDFMGGIQHVLDETNQWGLGQYMQQPARPFMDKSIVGGDVCTCGDVIVGDYLITYEIVRTALPDLRPASIRVADRVPGATDDEVCVESFNSGLEASPPFEMRLYVDGSPLFSGRTQVAGLAAHTGNETCFRATLPAMGSHDLVVIADENTFIPEMDELNNTLKKTLDRGPAGNAQPATGPIAASSGSGSTTPEGAGPKTGQPAPAPSPEPVPATGQGRSDLIVSAIRVEGRVPDGKDDCKDGGNDVAVVVKNTGAANAGSFVVRLTVDGDDGDEKTVNGLEAGKEREVKFDNIRLTKGERKLTAVVDAKETVAEASEENNERAVAANCKDD